MLDKMVEQLWLQLGAIGLLIIFLVIGICYLNKHITRIMKEHKGERDEWRKEALSQAEKTLDVVAQNSTVVSKLCTLIENRR